METTNNTDLLQQFINDNLKQFVLAGKLDAKSDYKCCIEKNPDQYRKYWTMDLINNADCIEDTYIYWSKEDAEADVAILAELTNIEEC